MSFLIAVGAVVLSFAFVRKDRKEWTTQRVPAREIAGHGDWSTMNDVQYARPQTRH